MKLNKILYLFFCVVATVLVSACNNNHELVSPHTDASVKVVGTYGGNMTQDGELVTDDVVINVTHLDVENTQAVTVHFTSAAKAMDQTLVCNVAAAGNRFALVPASSSKDAARNTSITIENDVLVLTTTLNSKFAVSAGSTAKRYTMTCVKK